MSDAKELTNQIGDKEISGRDVKLKISDLDPFLIPTIWFPIENQDDSILKAENSILEIYEPEKFHELCLPQEPLKLGKSSPSQGTHQGSVMPAAQRAGSCPWYCPRDKMSRKGRLGEDSGVSVVRTPRAVK